jgi:hypothetical protein
MKKQIEEMARVLSECCNHCDENGNHLRNKCRECEYWDDTNYVCCSFNTKEATALYNAGYRKQSEGEWIWTENGEADYEKYWVCSVCKEHDFVKTKFCSNCGAMMKGE